MLTAKSMIRLGGCPGSSESLLGAQVILLVLSWGGSNDILEICNNFWGHKANIDGILLPFFSLSGKVRGHL